MKFKKHKIKDLPQHAPDAIANQKKKSLIQSAFLEDKIRNY
jgi:hypothetical protein